MIGNSWGIVCALSWVFWTVVSSSQIFNGDSFGIVLLISAQPAGGIFLYWALVERRTVKQA